MTHEQDRTEAAYKIVRFSKSRRRRIIRRGLTLAEAQAWCSRDDTHGKTWFHGFERDNHS